MPSRFAWRPLVLCALALDATLGPASANSATATSSTSHAFGSVVLPLGSNRYSSRWHRVSSAGSSAQLVQIVAPARPMERPQQVSYINAALNHRITFRPDRADYWATAGETLNRSTGDCEDYAIAKMQALKALGVPPQDLFVTIGRDNAVRQGHAVLLVRAQGQFWVLDNRTDQLIPDDQFSDFHPIISLSADGRTWLHGRAVAPRRSLDEARS